MAINIVRDVKGTEGAIVTISFGEAEIPGSATARELLHAAFQQIRAQMGVESMAQEADQQIVILNESKTKVLLVETKDIAEVVK